MMRRDYFCLSNAGFSIFTFCTPGAVWGGPLQPVGAGRVRPGGLLLSLAIVPCLVAIAAAQVEPASPPEPSMASRFSSSVKSGFSKVGQALSPKSNRQDEDPISLSVPAKPSADFHVAVARMSEQSGDTSKAEFHYRQALDMEPKNFDALMGYAHLLDRQDKFSQAGETYRRAIQANPGNPATHNDLGICCARQGRLPEAIASIEKAIEQEPKQPRYRNNIATILVQAKQVDAAFNHLCAVHPKPVACYNLGYLLQKVGDKEGAARLFEEALTLDPSMANARTWLAHLRPSRVADDRSVSLQQSHPSRQPQVVAQRSWPLPGGTMSGARPQAPLPGGNNMIPPSGLPSPMPARIIPPPGSPAPMPAGPSMAPMPPSSVPAAARQASPPQLAPLPPIGPLPTTRPTY
ncbi:MAG: tetratricopeptide repeat protein [Thermoguttaceae bacterium]